MEYGGPYPMTGMSLQEGHVNIGRHMGERHVKMEDWSDTSSSQGTLRIASKHQKLGDSHGTDSS